VWRGIYAAEAAGLTPIKLNAVVVRHFNDGQDMLDLAQLTSKTTGRCALSR
jgi:cyclic pyranopterin phosphate synthase